MPLRVEGAARIMRGVPPRCCGLSRSSASRACLMAWSSRTGAAAGGYGGYRTRPVTGATGRGSSARRRASARRARRKLPPRLLCRPALTPAAYDGPLWPLVFPWLAAPPSRAPRPGRQARRAAGAPLNDCEENPHSYANGGMN